VEALRTGGEAASLQRKLILLLQGPEHEGQTLGEQAIGAERLMRRAVAELDDEKTIYLNIMLRYVPGTHENVGERYRQAGEALAIHRGLNSRLSATTARRDKYRVKFTWALAIKLSEMLAKGEDGVA
jgi:hypothetical protein